MEHIIIFFGLITFATMILGAINALVWKNENADSILDVIVHICAGIVVISLTKITNPKLKSRMAQQISR